MKKLIILIICFLPLLVKADTIPMDNYTQIGSDTNKPILVTINGSSSVNKTFTILDELNLYNDNFNYFGYTICSNALIQIKRRYSAGSNCNQSCYSNDMYLQLASGTMMNSNKCNVGDITNGYLYYWYYGANKWEELPSLRYDIADQITITNLGTSNAKLYFYNAIAFNDNPIPNLLQSDTIIDINNQNTQDIIDNQNQNTQDIIDSNKVCNTIDRGSIIYQNKFLNSSGTLGDLNGFGVTDYYSINHKVFEIIETSSVRYCEYDTTKTLIACHTSDNLGIINFNSQTTFVRFTINNTTNIPKIKYCSNGNEANYDAINDVNNSINNSGIDSPNSDLSDIADMVAENGVITQLLVLPITLYTAILNTINGECNDYVFGSLFGTQLKMTCVNVSSLLGSSLYNTIDIIISGLFVYGISKKMIKVFNNMSSLKEGDVIGD